MDEKPTKEMNELLAQTSPDELDAYFRQNEKYMAGGERAFYHYMKDLLRRNRILLKDLYSFAGVSESYGGKILTMEKPTKNRDLIIRFCVVGRFIWDETNRALKLYGFSEFYAKKPRDACLIVALNHRIRDLGEIDDLLIRRGFDKLSPDEPV